MKLAASLCVIIMLAAAGYAGPAEEQLTVDYLLAGAWGTEYKVGTAITFNKNSTYEAFLDYGQDFEQKKGSYKIRNGVLTLYLEDGTTEFLSGGRLVRDDSSAIFRFCIRFGNGTVVWNKKSPVSEKSRIMVDSVPVITMGRKRGTVTTNAKFREKPDTSSRALTLWTMKEEKDGPLEVQLPYVPAGTVIGVLGRTENRVKVEKWNNYWYYVEVFDAYHFNAQKAWMFGEFISIGR